MTSLSSRSLFDMVLGSIPSALLFAGMELNVFDRLKTPVKSDDLAREQGWNPANTKLFLNALCACRLVEKDQKNYRNTAVTQTYLASDSPLCLGPLFELSLPFWTGGLKDIPRQVRNGPVPPDPGSRVTDEGPWQDLTRAMAASQRAWLADFAVAQVRALKNKGHVFHRILDLGGGAGLVAMAMARAFPGIKGVVFDQPSVIRVACEFIEAQALSPRVSVMAGDYNSCDIGTGYDLIWISNSLHFSPSGLQPVMEKIYGALNPGGVCMILHEGLTHDRTAPAEHIMTGLMTALAGQDLFFDQGELAELMLDAGFTRVKSRGCDTDWGRFDLDIAFKQ